MHEWLFRARRLLGVDDRATAYRREVEALRGATARPTHDARLLDEMARLAAAPDETLVAGETCAEPCIEVRMPFTEVAGRGHALVLGASGSGKTRFVSGVVRDALRRIAHDHASMGLVVVDHKSEFVGLVRDLLRDLARELPERAARRLLDDLVVINPFSAEALVPLQVLKAERGVAPEVQAYEVTALINRMGGAELGVRQDYFLYHLMLLCVLTDRSLVDAARLLDAPEELTRAAAACPSDEVQVFFAGGQRVGAQSLEGVRARLHQLLRLPSARLMLGARDALSFRSLLASKIVLIDLGSAPRGCRDIAHFWAGLITLKLTNAIFERTPAEARRPVALFIDEWQEGLAAGGDLAEDYERVLSMARSRGVSLWLISQSLTGAARVSASLPKVVATNTNAQFLFRASAEDARAMAHLLSVTGRRPRPQPAPWEDRPRSPFLSSSEEREVLLDEIPSLPDRVFYYWNRRRPYRAVQLYAGEVAPRSARELGPREEWRLLHGALARPVSELAAEVRRAAGPRFRPLAPATPEAPPSPPERPRRPRRGARGRV